MHRIKRTWEIASHSLGVLSAERSLMAVSVLSYLAALVAAGIVFFAGLALVGPAGEAEGVAAWLVVGAAALAATLVSAAGQGAVIAGAAQRMEGADPTIGSALAVVRRRLWPLFTWAVLATVVGRVLQLLRRRGTTGTTASAGGGLAFGVVSFLALPVIVFEGTGAVPSLKRSWELLKRTWGENLTFNFGLKVLGLVLFAPAAAAVGVAIWAGIEPLPFAAFLAVLLWGVVVLGLVSALSAVFKTALYRWANDLPVDPSFDRRELEQAFGRS